ncbi:zinc finger protein 540-like [Tachysurus ichikawai]
MKTTGHEKSHLTVVLAAKADGTKLKPYIVFKGGIKEVKSMQNISGVLVATSKNGWLWDIAVISAQRPKLSSKGATT